MIKTQLIIEPSKKYHSSPLRYPGGKTWLLPFLDQLIKKNKLFDTTYIEPFAGGAGAGISLLLLEKVERIIINDLDPAIFSFWKAITERTEEFINKILVTPINIEEWRRQRLVYKSKKTPNFQLGFATFYLNRTNRSGIIEGGVIGGIKQDGQWKIDARFNKETLINRIRKIGEYKNRIKVTNLDGLSLLSKLKRKRNFIYIDPPYFIKGASLYLNHYVPENHISLAKFLNKNIKMNWLLTYDNVEAILKLYPKRRLQNFSLSYSAQQRVEGKEIMIFSDSLCLPKLGQV